ncbi:MAG: type II secretion system secretin GspD [Gammaproteobacteria bacterium]
MSRYLSVYATKIIALRAVQRYCRYLLLVVFTIPLLAVAEPATLNFKDADIRALITTVAEVTGKNFIVDPRINGRVTIISSRPMEKNEIYQVFLSVLEVNGFAAVPAGNAIKIIPDANAKFNDIPTTDSENPGSGDEIVTRVVELQNVQAAQLVPILRPLASPQAHMAAFPENNMLVISDRAGNTDRLAKLIRNIDRPSTDEVEIIRLQHAAAAELVRILTTLEQQNIQANPTGSRTTLIADERTNSVLISGDKAERLRIRATISHLDTAIDDGGGDTHVIYLRYAKATDLVEVLTGVPARRGRDASGDTLSPGGLLSGEPDNNIPSLALENPQPNNPTPLIRPGQQGIPGGNPNNEVKLSIQADEATNALVITASPAQFASIQAVVRQLDIRRAQVVVEAVIAEVSSTKAAQLGIQYVFGGGSVAGIVGGTAINATTGVPGIAVDTSALARSGISLGYFGSGGFADVRAVITALLSDADTNVLSTPTLVTLDNQEAEIIVGQNVPFVTGNFTGLGDTAATNPFQTIQREDVGLKLKIKPQINEGDAVTLEIEQEVSSISPSTASASDIITDKRAIKTTVTVDDGKIVVLGGLIDNNVVDSVRKVPLLGDLPVLGALFRSKSSTVRKTNLMVFLHPVIVRDPATGARIASSKYNYIRAEQLKKAEDGVALQPNQTPPVLPPIEQLLNEAPASIGQKAQTIIPPVQTDPDNKAAEPGSANRVPGFTYTGQ